MTDLSVTVGHKIKTLLSCSDVREIQKDLKQQALDKLSSIKDLIEQESGAINLNLVDLDSMDIKISLSGFSPELHAKIFDFS